MKTNHNFAEMRLFGEKQRPAKTGGIELLRGAGESFINYGIRLGDTIVFPALGKEVVKEQPIRVGSTAVASLIGVERNDKGDFLAMGSLARRDKDNNAACPFSQDLLGFIDHETRFANKLAGRTIKCVAMKEMQVRKFVDRVPAFNEDGTEATETRQFPVIEYVD